MPRKRSNQTQQSNDSKSSVGDAKTKNRYNLFAALADDETNEVEENTDVEQTDDEVAADNQTHNEQHNDTNINKGGIEQPVDDDDGFVPAHKGKKNKNKDKDKVNYPAPVSNSDRTDLKRVVKIIKDGPEHPARTVHQEHNSSRRTTSIDKDDVIDADLNKTRNETHNETHNETRYRQGSQNTSDDSGDTQRKLYVPPTIGESEWQMSGGRRRREKDRQEPEVDEKEVDNLEYYNPAIKYPGDDMKLNSSWTVWIHENDNPNWDLKSYQDIYTINSIGSMWRFLSVFDNLNKNVRQYFIMRDGITPIWEDNNNKQGAICSIMIDNMNRGNRYNRGDLGVDAFAAMCILVMNESFVKNNGDINGLCYSIKSKSVLIKIWVKDYKNNEKFNDKLPFTFLKTLESMLDNRGYTRSSNRSMISVQTKPIKPNY